MKLDLGVSPFGHVDSGPIDADLSPVERMIVHLVEEHLLDLVDFRRISQLETVIGMRLADLVATKAIPPMENWQISERATEIIGRAWHRVIEDPRCFEANAGDPWETDDDCELCKMLEADAKKPAKGARTS